MALDFTQLHHSITGPAEGLIANITPKSIRITSLRALFPEHWEHSYIELVWLPGAASAVLVELSVTGVGSARMQLTPFKPVRFLAKGREFLRVAFSGSPTTDSVRISVVSQDTGQVDNWGFTEAFGKVPDTFLHADRAPGVVGTVVYPAQAGNVSNQTQVASPLIANSWVGGKRALDFTGNKALQFYSLAPLLPNVSGPITIVMAVNVPNTAAVRGLFDFQDSALPATRYFDCYLLGTDALSLYCQGASGAISANSPVFGPELQGVPLLLGVTKHATSWDVCALTDTTETDIVSGALHNGAGAAAFNLMTIGAEYDGTTFTSHANMQLRAFAMWTGIDIPIAALRNGLRHFRDALDCPLA